jgi:hypothetical protein
MGDETQPTLHNLFTAPHWVQEGWKMSDAIKKLEDAKHHMDAHDYYDCRIAIDAAIEALQSGEPVAWMSPNKQSLEFSRPDTVYGSHTIPLYTTPQPVVDEAVFDILKAAQGSCRLGLNDIADKQIEIAIKALLSAGKGE